MKLQDFDLDVKNATKDFPQNDSDCFLYLSGTSDGNEMQSFMLCSGTVDNLCNLVFSSMERDMKFFQVVLGSAAVFLRENPKEMARFLMEAGAILQNKNMN